ncbi:hypothetical protein NYE39_15175 [Janibacter sp. FSL W8-0316]|uniref:hypothetical protein n=1 Tax=Janibacter sp. FSL W8-0316 TaxID=2975325 RepID=UPI0030FAD3E0
MGPPATNVGPGPLGYVWVLLVLTGALWWFAAAGHGRRGVVRAEVWAGGALLGWLWLSLLRSGERWDTALAATALATLALLTAWAWARAVEPEERQQALVLVLGAAALGTVLAAWVVPLVIDQSLGWRPGLPIGGASNNAVGLTLVLAGALTGRRLWPEQRWLWLGAALVTALLIVQSLSRAGWVLALVVAVVAIVRHRHWNLRWGGPVVLLVVAVVLGELTRRRGLSLLVDESRWHNAAVGVEAWSGSAGTVLFGLGPMRMWPWMELERGRPGEQFDGPLQYDGPWGAVLYHAHSTYLGLLVEYGIVGLVLLLVVLGLVVRRGVLEIRRGGRLELVAVAVLLALPAMLVETYLVRGFPSAWLFWCAVLVVGAGFEAPSSHLNQRGDYVAPQPAGVLSRLLRRTSTSDRP